MSGKGLMMDTVAAEETVCQCVDAHAYLELGFLRIAQRPCSNFVHQSLYYWQR